MWGNGIEVWSQARTFLLHAGVRNQRMCVCPSEKQDPRSTLSSYLTPSPPPSSVWSEHQLILIFSLFLFCFVLFNALSLAFFVRPMSICPLCHGCGAFLAWCHPFLSCLPSLPAGSPGGCGQRTTPDCRILGKVSATSTLLSTGSDLPPSLVGSSPALPPS